MTGSPIVNQSILVGELGRDPVIRTIPSNGEKLAELRLKVVDQVAWGADVRTRTDWIDVVVRELHAFVIADTRLRAGDRVRVVGKLQKRNAAPRGEEARWVTEVVVVPGGSLERLGGG